MRNVILGSIVGYEVETIRPFFETLNDTGSDCDVFMFCADLSPETLRYIESFPFVKVVDIHNCENIVKDRWWMYIDFLLLNEIYDLVLCTDVRDVIFQADPFQWSYVDDAVTVAVEKKAIGQCEINSEWVKEAFGDEMLEKLAGFITICAGTICGPRDLMIKHLHAMTNMLRTASENNPNPTPMQKHGVDQASHNVLVHLEKPVQYDPLDFVVGPVATILFYDESELYFDDDGNVLNEFGIVPIVHQYLGKPTIEATLRRKGYK